MFIYIYPVFVDDEMRDSSRKNLYLEILGVRGWGSGSITIDIYTELMSDHQLLLSYNSLFKYGIYQRIIIIIHLYRASILLPAQLRLYE